MRYERVQEILQGEPALKPMISARNQAIDSRFGEKMLFSKEVIQVTQAIHSEGKDAHKLPKNEVLKFALRVLRMIPNGQNRAAPSAEAEKKSVKARASKTRPGSRPEPARTPRPVRSARPKPAPPEKHEEPASNGQAPAPEIILPESELPPDKQPLHLPAGFDPKKYPHYDVQSSVYSMLLSALTLSLHFEKFPNKEERQGKLEILVSDYCKTCNQIDPN